MQAKSYKCLCCKHRFSQKGPIRKRFISSYFLPSPGQYYCPTARCHIIALSHQIRGYNRTALPWRHECRGKIQKVLGDSNRDGLVLSLSTFDLDPCRFHHAVSINKTFPPLLCSLPNCTNKYRQKTAVQRPVYKYMFSFLSHN